MKHTWKIIFLAVALALAITPMLFAQEDYDAYAAQQLSAQAQANNSQSLATVEGQNPPEIHLTRTTKVGDLTLIPGDYAFNYRVKGTHHFIHVTREYTVQEVHPETSEITYTEDVGNVNCQLQPLRLAATTTSVQHVEQGNVTRITSLQIKGDAVAHLL